MSTHLLWQSSGSSTDEAIMRFLAGEDVILDRELLPFDIQASRAHVTGLGRIGIVTAAEAAALDTALGELEVEVAAGRFVLDERFEDGHSAIEAWLTDRLGDVGRKVHTGRSRNDQVLVASRLFLKARLLELSGLCRAIARVCLDRAAMESEVPMPGYTHLQRAVVSSAGHWWAGWAEAFVDNAWRARQTQDWIDANPLGTAAGYGVNLPLNREHTTQALGFARLQVNPHYAQLSRGKFELAVLEALAHPLLDVRRLAWDLSLFSSAEFGFVALPDIWTTGSSIMPNKRNPDVVELLRARYGVVAGARVEIEQVLALPSGYHRDLQFTKAPLIRALRQGLDALALLPRLLEGLQWNPARMLQAIEPSMYATDLAVELARDGVPFREAYRQVKERIATLADREPAASLAARTSPGAPGALRLDLLEARWLALSAPDGG
ncbi:MAG TPA: argininosuccinate lyase [Xanthomonadaceae bacterium]|nr:argininosuccinate lyase [Xanthomonadaceae bacterium]